VYSFANIVPNYLPFVSIYDAYVDLVLSQEDKISVQ